MSVKDPVKFTVSGRNYVTIPLTGRDSIRLDKMVSPIIFSMSHVAKKVTAGELAVLMSQKMGELSDDEFDKILKLSFRGTMFSGSEKEKSFSLDSDECYDHFEGRLLDMYNVLVCAWQAHNLTPFRMSAGASTEETA